MKKVQFLFAPYGLPRKLAGREYLLPAKRVCGTLSKICAGRPHKVCQFQG